MWLRDFVKFLTATSARRPTRRPSSAPLSLKALEHRDVPSYSVIDLGALGVLGSGGYSYTRASDINAAGQVVGESNGHAFLWQNGIMTDLGSLGGGSRARGMNDLGQIVGESTSVDGVDHAFLLTPEDADGNGAPDRWFRDSNNDGTNDLMFDLGPNSVANDVNNVGRVVGVSNGHAFLWQNGTMTDLGSLGGNSYSEATAINDAGQVTGTAYKTTSEGAGFLWQGFLWQDGVMHDLGAPFGGGASDINQSGQIVGAPAYHDYASLWTPATPNGTEGSFTSLGALPPDPPYTSTETEDTYSIAAGLNDVGAVVGNSYTTHSYADPDGGYYSESVRGFVWADGVMQDLSEWRLQDATAINNAGQIVGNGLDPTDPTGSNRAFLLTPQSAATPLVRIGDVTVAEGNTGTRAATFTVTLSAASTQPVTVAYSTVSGSATAGNDYQSTSGTLTIPAGQTTARLTVPVNGDRLPEPNETYFVNLGSPTNATIADGQGTGTIVDDEPRVGVGDVTRAEGKKGQTTAFTFTVTLSAAYDQPVTMSFKTTDGTAKASDSDYVARTGTVTFAPGETTKTITITVNGDSKKEADETFYLDLSGLSSNALFAKSRGTGTILNDD